MFVRASTLVVAIIASVIASPGVMPDDVNQCNVGTIECCSDTMSANQNQDMLGSLGLGPVAGLLALNCDPLLSGLGVGADCTAQTVCCSGTKNLGENNDFGPLIGIDCSPINLGL
ncbi:hypothetical protein V8E55_010363 [Tylopilus felleus]